jgi:hypothetical protein
MTRGVVVRTVVTRILVILCLVGTAASAFPLAAHAAPPTRIVDRTADVVCTGVSQDVEITVGVARSELAGTHSAVQLSYASSGESIGRFDSGTSGWGDGTFRAVIPVFDLNDEPAGEVYFSGNYIPTGEPQVTHDKFNAGNVHVVEKHIETFLTISDVTLTYDDNDTAPGDVTFADLTCEGSVVEGSLFFTNPATLVQIGTNVVFDPDGCTTSNLETFTIESTEGTLEELFVEVTYADRPEASASGVIVADGGTWTGSFRLRIGDELVGTVDATATLERGRPFHGIEGETGMRNHIQVTPYHFTLVVEGPDSPAELDCTLFQLREKLHMPNPSG